MQERLLIVGGAQTVKSATNMSSARSTVVHNGAARLYLREIGNGPPVVVLHGGPDLNHDYLLPDFDRLADIARLVIYDQRGRGQSYAGERAADITLETEMADLDRVREWAGSDAVALVGHSWGALLAMEYATRHPRHVAQLILMNSAPASHADMLVLRKHLTDIRGPELLAEMRAIKDGEAYRNGDLEADAQYLRLHFRHAVRRSEHLESLVGRLRRGFSPESIVVARQIDDQLYDQTWGQPDYDLHPRLAQLRIPTLVLHGDHDFIPVEVARRIAASIPDARLTILPDCGHFAYLEQPASVHTAVAKFLARA